MMYIVQCINQGEILYLSNENDDLLPDRNLAKRMTLETAEGEIKKLVDFGYQPENILLQEDVPVLTVDVAKRLVFERGLNLPVGNGQKYETQELEEIAVFRNALVM